jgi:von Willebrand factor type A domain
MKFYSSIAVLLAYTPMQTNAGEAEFEALVARMENDVISFAREVESQYQNRCNEISLQECSQGNYDECSSLLPNQICPGGEDLNNARCGDGISCSAFWDYSVSNVRLHRDLTGADGRNPTDKSVIETICFTQQLDEYFLQQRSDQEQYWKSIGSRTPQMYFGSRNGAFRIYPARHSEVCGDYDPRLRPWYVAASSGPKNLVLVLDTSGSMEGERLDLMKKAAKQVVNTMTVADRIAIVEFNAAATLHGRDNKFLFTATRDNLALLSATIDGFSARGGTNFLDAFTKTFQVLDDSITAELHVSSTTAILFLTDGEMTEPANNLSEESVLDLVSTGISSLKGRIGKTVFLFTYSIAINDENVHQFPKKIACATGDDGVWSKIIDNQQIFDSLTSYYQLLALGLGVERNANFTAWVEPYPFASGNILGTTVSAPVYDRTKTPPVFLGVVGIDFPLTVVDRVIGNAVGSQDSIDRIVKQSTAFIPVIELGLCELESFRRIGSVGDEALCTATCNATDFVQVEELACSSVSDYPKNLFINGTLTGLSYEERACCVVNETTPDVSNQCALKGGDGIGTGAIIGIVLGCAAATLIAGWIVYKNHKNYLSGHKFAAKTVNGGTSTVPISSLHPVQPPQNPYYNEHASAPLEA